MVYQASPCLFQVYYNYTDARRHRKCPLHSFVGEWDLRFRVLLCFHMFSGRLQEMMLEARSINVIKGQEVSHWPLPQLAANH